MAEAQEQAQAPPSRWLGHLEVGYASGGLYIDSKNRELRTGVDLVDKLLGSGAVTFDSELSAGYA